MDLSCTEISDDACSVENRKLFPLFVYLTPPLTRFPLEYCNGGGGGAKNWNDAHTIMSIKCDDLCLRLYTLSALDAWTEIVKQHGALHA